MLKVAVWICIVMQKELGDANFEGSRGLREFSCAQPALNEGGFVSQI